VKAIIPVAGAGAKLRPLTYTQPKALIPIAGKTLLSIIVDQLLEGGVNEFIFVIGYLGEKIRDYVEATYPDLKKQYVQQTQRRGIGHAVWLTRNAVAPDEEILIVLGDTVAEYDIRAMLAAPVSQIAVRKVDDPRSFGVAEIDAANRIYRVVEKPLIPKSNLAMVGVYYLRESAALFGALEAQLDPVCGNGVEEYHLTHAIQDMIQQDIPIHAFRVDNWYDCGKKETLLATNALLLNQMAEQGDFPQSLAELKAQHPEAVFIPPVHVAPGCTFRQSIIGPNVSIGENTAVARAIIRDSIIGSYAELKDVSLHQSIIGNDAFVHGASQSLNIGDNTEIDLR
jgi:glucose-1-phosphate thymidylyltransferase